MNGSACVISSKADVLAGSSSSQVSCTANPITNTNNLGSLQVRATLLRLFSSHGYIANALWTMKPHEEIGIGST